jgi:hypothetical protein
MLAVFVERELQMSITDARSSLTALNPLGSPPLEVPFLLEDAAKQVT